VNKPPLGKLENVNLREYWKSESHDFTPWLASDENIKLLGEAIGIELEVEAQEKNVGPFKADILCKDTTTDKWVLIENQLEPTDHSHLGQILTYAAGLNAPTIVWIAQDFTAEHRATIDWLNEITDEGYNFFGIQIELWRIGQSEPAPRFNVVAKPNDWSKTVEAAVRQGELTEGRQKRLKFWTAFKEYMVANSKIRCQKPAPQQWMNHSIGRSGFGLASIVSTWDSQTSRFGSGELRVELSMGDANADAYFEQLKSNQADITKEIGETLTWHNPPDTRTRKIYVRCSADVDDESKWPEYQVWLRGKLEAFYRVFAPRVKALSKDAGISDIAEKTN